MTQLPFMQPGGYEAAALEQLYDQTAAEPLGRDATTGYATVGTHGAAVGVLRDLNHFLNAATLAPHFPICEEAGVILGSRLADSVPVTAGGDGKTHAVARQVIRDTFATTPSQAEPTFGGLVDRHINRLAEDLPNNVNQEGSVDLIEHFAWQLPLRVMNDILGIPPERYEDVKQWSMGQIALTWGRPDIQTQIAAAEGLGNLWDLCKETVQRRRELFDAHQELTDDLASRLVADGRLPDAHSASILLNFAVAGHETTANGIGNAVFDLLARREAGEDWWAGLATDPKLVKGVVEEELRLNPPIAAWSRLAAEGATVAGAPVEPGSRLLVLLGAANRDPQVYGNPHQFDPNRTTLHLSFGRGIHFCVGAALARLEMQRSLTVLSERFPGARLAEGFLSEPDKHHHNIGFCALRQLPVRLTAQA